MEKLSKEHKDKLTKMAASKIYHLLLDKLYDADFQDDTIQDVLEHLEPTAQMYLGNKDLEEDEIETFDEDLGTCVSKAIEVVAKELTDSGFQKL